MSIESLLGIQTELKKPLIEEESDEKTRPLPQLRDFNSVESLISTLSHVSFGINGKGEAVHEIRVTEGLRLLPESLKHLGLNLDLEKTGNSVPKVGVLIGKQVQNTRDVFVTESTRAARMVFSLDYNKRVGVKHLQVRSETEWVDVEREVDITELRDILFSLVNRVKG